MRRPLNSFRVISSTHGQATGMGFFGKHLGTDYATPIGTPVYAPTGGKITETPWSSTVGQQVYMTDSQGRIHRFMHLNQEFVWPGQQVSEGQHIAMSGNTGSNTTGSHCHWDVRKGGTLWNSSFSNYYNPEALVAAAKTLAPGVTVYLKPTVSRWRFYAPNVRPKVGLELGYLNPAKYGGLTYTVLAVPFPSTATIQSQNFGRVNIFIDSDAEIR